MRASETYLVDKRKDEEYHDRIKYQIEKLYTDILDIVSVALIDPLGDTVGKWHVDTLRYALQAARKDARQNDYALGLLNTVRLFNNMRPLDYVLAKASIETVKVFVEIQRLVQKRLEMQARDVYEWENEEWGMGYSLTDKEVKELTAGEDNGTDWRVLLWLDAYRPIEDARKMARVATTKANRSRKAEPRRSFSRAMLYRQFDKIQESMGSWAWVMLATQASRVYREAMQKYHEKRGTRYYNFLTQGDEVVCEECSAIEAGNPYKLEDMAGGFNAPYIHPRCRCRIEFI